MSTPNETTCFKPDQIKKWGPSNYGFREDRRGDHSKFEKVG